MAWSPAIRSSTFAPALLVACVVAGAGVSVQSALNGQVARATDSAVAAATVSFGVGLVALVLVLAGLVAGGHRYPAFPTLPTYWWLYTGGLFGLAFVTVVAGVVRVVGVLVVTLATVAGQVVGDVMNLLFLAGSQQKVWDAVENGELGKRLAKNAEQSGFVLLGWWALGARHFLP